jgi:hypothetical protein
MIEVWAVLDGAVQTVAIFSTKAAADEYAGDEHQVYRDWVFETPEEAKLRDDGWARGDFDWHRGGNG